MRRGFKSECERRAEAIRRRVGSALDTPLDLEALAAHLGVTVWRPEDVPNMPPEALTQLVRTDGDSWSAVTMHVGSDRLTIVNSAHARTRQRSSIAHEFAHLVLDHKPDRVDVSKRGHLILSSFERDNEDEATWLAGALLVPREGLRRAFRRTEDVGLLAARFDVSAQLLQWRLGTTGVAVQARRAKAHRRSSPARRA